MASSEVNFRGGFSCGTDREWYEVEVEGASGERVRWRWW